MNTTLTAKQKAALTRAAKTNKRAAFLRALLDAQNASDSAKATSANGLHFRAYLDSTPCCYRYARANYRRSRAARAARYEEKEEALERAVPLARELGVVFGYKDGVLYFELSTGQVSFHVKSTFGAPDYAGTWDGKKESRQNIELAVLELVDPAAAAAIKEERRAARRVEFAARLAAQRDCSRPVKRHNTAKNWHHFLMHSIGGIELQGDLYIDRYYFSLFDGSLIEKWNGKIERWIGDNSPINDCNKNYYDSFYERERGELWPEWQQAMECRDAQKARELLAEERARQMAKAQDWLRDFEQRIGKKSSEVKLEELSRYDQLKLTAIKKAKFNFEQDNSTSRAHASPPQLVTQQV